MAKLTIFRGTSYDMTYAHIDSAGNPVSLVGCTVYFTVKSEEYDNDQTDTSAIIKKTVLPGEHTDAAAGRTAWLLNDSDTWKEPGDYFFSVIVEDADGLAEPPSLYGDWVIKGTTTNRNVGNE